MTALEELLRVPHRRENPYIEEWKKNGGRVVGFTCSYVPEEIIHAAGVLPYRNRGQRLRGHRSCRCVHASLQLYLCPMHTPGRFVGKLRVPGWHVPAQRLRADPPACTKSGIKSARPIYMYMITVPHSVYDEGLGWYRDELYNFKEKLINDFGLRCSLDRTWRTPSRSTMRQDALIMELYELRKAESVPISGSDALRMVLSAYVRPRERYNSLLAEALEEVRAHAGRADHKARLLVGGSAVDSPELFEIIEGMGGIIVTDTLCYGSRQFNNKVSEEGDPLDALARTYYVSNPCPRMMNEYKNRLKYTEEMAGRRSGGRGDSSEDRLL